MLDSETSLAIETDGAELVERSSLDRGLLVAVGEFVAFVAFVAVGEFVEQAPSDPTAETNPRTKRAIPLLRIANTLLSPRAA